MFVVVQVTLLVDSPRLENEVMLNHRNNWSQLFNNQTIFLYSATRGWFDLYLYKAYISLPLIFSINTKSN